MGPLEHTLDPKPPAYEGNPVIFGLSEYLDMFQGSVGIFQGSVGLAQNNASRKLEKHKDQAQSNHENAKFENPGIGLAFPDPLINVVRSP